MSMHNSSFDFLMIYPETDFRAYSQRLLLGLLEREGFSVHLLFIPTVDGIEKEANLRQSFLEIIEQSQVVGFGFMSTGYKRAATLTRLIKSNFKKTVIWGGPHSTIAYKRLIDHPDAICVGEGDVVLVEFVKAVKTGLDYKKIPGIITLDSELVPVTKEYVVENIDLLPIPFYRKNGQTAIFENKMEAGEMFFTQALSYIQIMTTRGCPYSCTYCANSYLKETMPGGVKVIRKRSVNSVIDELKYCKELYTPKHFVIEDDLFLIRSDDDLQSFVEIYNKEIGIPIGITGISPTYLTRRKMDIIQHLPLSSLRIGFQTASQNGLSVYKRHAVNQRMDNVIEVIRSVPKHINVEYDIILDNPYEKDDDYVETLKFLTTLPRPYGLLLYHLTLYEGTELRALAIKDGIINPEDEGYFNRSYCDLDDSYVNSIFLLLLHASGYIPQWIVKCMLSSFIMDKKTAKRIMKNLVMAIVKVLDKSNFRAMPRRIFKILNSVKRMVKKNGIQRGGRGLTGG